MSDADEMILAGSRPTHGNPIDALHKRVSVVLLIDSFVLFMVAQIFVSPILALIPAMMGGVVWLMYRTKVEWAYWFAPIVMALVSGLFCILLFLNVQSILLGNVGTGAFLMTILIGWATFSSIRFIRIHFHPVYKMGYSGHSVYDEGIQLEANEMLAACPTCLAVLAVNPLLLSPDDSCPHCGSPLVTNDSEEE